MFLREQYPFMHFEKQELMLVMCIWKLKGILKLPLTTMIHKSIVLHTEKIIWIASPLYMELR